MIYGLLTQLAANIDTVHSGLIDAIRGAYIAFLKRGKGVAPLVIKEDAVYHWLPYTGFAVKEFSKKETTRPKHGGGRPWKLSARDERNTVHHLNEGR